MQHIKLIKRPDGKQVEIHVWPNIGFHEKKIGYRVIVFYCLPKKRTFHHVYSGDDWEYRKLTMEERPEYVKKKQLEHVTPEEIMAAKIECWNLLKPE